MRFSLSAKPPKAKPKKLKDSRPVMRTGRGGAGGYRKKVPKAPAELASLASDGQSVVRSTSGSGIGAAPQAGSISDPHGSHLNLSRITQSIKSGTTVSPSEGEENEDRLTAPAGREILSAKHRKIYSGRGGAGNKHTLVADDKVYEGVLLHEQGILQAYNAERKAKEGTSTGRGGYANIKRKKKSPYSDSSSIRSRASSRSWGSSSFSRRAQQSSTSVTRSNTSLSQEPIPSLQTIPANDFGTSVVQTMMDKGIFDRVIEEEESEAAVASSVVESLRGESVATGSELHHPTIHVTITPSTSSVGDQQQQSPAPSPSPSLQHVRSPASKPISPNAISSGSWIANNLQEPQQQGRLSKSPTPKHPISSGTSRGNVARPTSPTAQTSLAGRIKSGLQFTLRRTTSSEGSHDREAMASPLSSPVVNITSSPSTTPTANSYMRTNAHNSFSPDPSSPLSPQQQGHSQSTRPRASSNQANRNASVYSPEGLTGDGSVGLYTGHSQEPSNLPYLGQSSAPRPSGSKMPVAEGRQSPSAGKTLNVAPTPDALDPRHARHMSSSSTSGSDLDLSGYNFPDAPGHSPVVRPRDTEPIHTVIRGGNGELMTRRPSEPMSRTISQTPPPSHPLPPTPVEALPSAPTQPLRAGRAPVQPGAYQAALRSIIDDVPDGPPPLYQPPASSRRYHNDTSTAAESEYPDSPVPAGYHSPYRVSSPYRSPSKTQQYDTHPNQHGNASSRPRATGPASPLAEYISSADGNNSGPSSPVERYSEKSYYGTSRSNTNRRPSDPYQRILAAAAMPVPPGGHSPNGSPSSSRRGSSSNQGQTLSPLSATSPGSPYGSGGLEDDDPLSRPTSQTFSTYTRGTRHSTWDASQVTATAVDHHEDDFPNAEDAGTYYTSMLADLDPYNPELAGARDRKRVPSSAKEKESSAWRQPDYPPSPPLPQIPKHLLGRSHQQQSRLQQSLYPPQTQHAPANRSPSRQLPIPPVGPPPAAPRVFPNGMGWDELNRPPPRKLSKMEKALLRRVEFGAVAAADIASIPLA